MNRSAVFAAAAATFATVLLSTATTHASVVLNIGGEFFRDQLGNPVPTGTLFQLVNLGADGVFNLGAGINGSVGTLDIHDSNPSQWVMGDDSLLGIGFTTGGGTPSDFSSTDAFDLSVGSGTVGSLDRVFELASNSVPEGTKIGIRWFPSIAATDFSTTELKAGEWFGQFTRTASPVHGGVVWSIPADGASVTFDPLLTTDAGGFDAPQAGFAVYQVVPEPSSAALLLLGGVSVLGRRRAKRA